MAEDHRNLKQNRKNKLVVLKAAWHNQLVLKLLSISLSVGIAFSVGLNLYQSNTISSLDQTVAAQNSIITSNDNVIDSQNTTINNLRNESSVQAYEALKAELASTQALLQNATAQLNRAQGSITSLQVQLAQERGNVSSLQAQLTKSAGDVSSLQAQLASAASSASNLQNQIGSFNQLISQLQAQVSNLTAQGDHLQSLLSTYWVQVSGGASSKNKGTTATWVYFYSNGVRYGTPVTSNVYSFKIPNNSTYEIFIQWNSAINEGVCDTGQGFMAQGAQTTYQLNSVSC